jgi:hypothetical protein
VEGYDWLDEDPIEPDSIEEAVETVQLPAIVKPIRTEKNRRAKALVLEERDLMHGQRIYLHCLLQSATLAEAENKLRLAGYILNRTTLMRWRKLPRFIKAMDLAQKELFQVLAITKEKVLIDAEHIKDMALTPHPILYKGEDTGFTQVEYGAALKALELQGKGVGLVDPNRERVQVLIDIDFSGRQEQPVIDVNGE